MAAFFYLFGSSEFKIPLSRKGVFKPETSNTITPLKGIHV